MTEFLNLILKPSPKSPNQLGDFLVFINLIHKNGQGKDFTISIESIGGYLSYTVRIHKDFFDKFKVIVNSSLKDVDIEITNTNKFKHYKSIFIGKSYLIPIKISQDIDTSRTLVETLSKLAQNQDVSFEIEFKPYKKSKLNNLYSEVIEPITLSNFDSGQKENILIKKKENWFDTKIRIYYNNPETFDKELINVFLKLFGSKYTNYLKIDDASDLDKKYFKLCSSEITALIHLPTLIEENTKLIIKNKKTLIVPKEITDNAKNSNSTIIGTGISEMDDSSKIAINHEDRFKHVYIIGKTGSGKTKLIENMIRQDIAQNRCAVLLDPHGDSALELLKLVDDKTRNSIAYIDFANTDIIPTFNPLENISKYKEPLIDSVLEAFKSYIGGDWNLRMEFLLRQILSALSYQKNPNIGDIHKMLIDNKFKDEIIKNIDDPAIKSFWSTEYIKFSESYYNQAVSPILSKIGQLLSNQNIRYIIGSTSGSFNLAKLIDEKKIIIFNLSIGILGQNASNLLGALIISQLVQIMFYQDNKDSKSRNEVFLYVDEFQNFGSDSFIKILSEARKFRLGITLAHQYASQIDNNLLKAILGNVSSIITFRLGHQDATLMSIEFQPYLEPQDFIQINSREFWARLYTHDKSARPFGGKTQDLIYSSTDYSRATRHDSNIKYAKLKMEIEKEQKEGLKFTNNDDKNSFSQPIV